MFSGRGLSWRLPPTFVARLAGRHVESPECDFARFSVPEAQNFWSAMYYPPVGFGLGCPVPILDGGGSQVRVLPSRKPPPCWAERMQERLANERCLTPRWYKECTFLSSDSLRGTLVPSLYHTLHLMCIERKASGEWTNHDMFFNATEISAGCAYCKAGTTPDRCQ